MLPKIERGAGEISPCYCETKARKGTVFFNTHLFYIQSGTWHSADMTNLETHIRCVIAPGCVSLVCPLLEQHTTTRERFRAQLLLSR